VSPDPPPGLPRRRSPSPRRVGLDDGIFLTAFSNDRRDQPLRTGPPRKRSSSPHRGYNHGDHHNRGGGGGYASENSINRGLDAPRSNRFVKLCHSSSSTTAPPDPPPGLPRRRSPSPRRVVGWDSTFSTTLSNDRRDQPLRTGPPRRRSPSPRRVGWDDGTFLTTFDNDRRDQPLRTGPPRRRSAVTNRGYNRGDHHNRGGGSGFASEDPINRGLSAPRSNRFVKLLDGGRS